MFFSKLPTQLMVTLGRFSVQVTRKDIRTVRLSIRKATGEIRLSVPKRFSDSAIQEFLKERISWIETHFPGSVTHLINKYQTGDSILFLGTSYRLNFEVSQIKKIHTQFDGDKKIFQIFLVSEEQRDSYETIDVALYLWYRKEFEKVLQELVPKCEATVGKKGNKWKIRRMKSRWGTCNVRTGDICLNLELIRFSKKHIEYVIIHELVHLYEPSHNARFYTFMDQFCPDWKMIRTELNGRNE